MQNIQHMEKTKEKVKVSKKDTKHIERIWQVFSNPKNSQEKDDAKEQLILYYAGMIKYIAGRMGIHVGNLVDIDDLISYGIFGLIDAIDKFDYGKGVKFETYASLRIRGAIIDGLRSLDWIPRTLRQKNRQIDLIHEELTASLGREPTNEELAQKMGITIEEVEKEIKKTSIMSLISLNEYLDQNHEVSFDLKADEKTPAQTYEQKELKQTLIDALDGLTEKERLVVTLYYFEEMTLKEISQTMKVTESRVSQLHSKALLKLRNKLGKHKYLLLD